LVPTDSRRASESWGVALAGRFTWGWMFWENGKQVAYRTGSLHFNMWCILVDISSGRQLANHYCYRELADAAPPWEKALQDAR